MQLRTRTWCLISLACFVGAAYFWRLGNEYGARPARPTDPVQTPASPATAVSPSGNSGSPPANGSTPAAAPTPGQTNAAQSSFLQHRLSNTGKTLDELSRTETAILLMNAQIDTSLPIDLKIPAQLRAAGDPEAYVVQARGLLTDAFRT